MTAAIAIAAEAPQIATAPPVSTPNLCRYPSRRARRIPNPIVSATDSTTMTTGSAPSAVICPSVMRAPSSATPMRNSVLAENWMP
jgi:hypothetical protein